MSHFSGLVILTPEYAEFHDLEDSLEKYNENLEVPEYSRGEVSNYEKVEFIEYYLEKDGIKFVELKEKLYNTLSKENKISKPFNGEDNEFERYLRSVVYDNKDRYAELFKETYPDYFNRFEELYNEHGEDWNGNRWRINYMTGNWEEYSTYNPNSKWDWYDENGRWGKGIKTKDDEYVNECLLGEIDWTDFKPEDYEEEEDVRWHFTKSNLPFCIVVDGEWIEKGEMGWWAMTSNEMSNEDWNEKMFEIINNLPENSEVHNIDFHI